MNTRLLRIPGADGLRAIACLLVVWHHTTQRFNPESAAGWIQNISISMGLVNTNTTPLLLKLVMSKKIQAEKFATHFFTFDQFIDAYDTFGRAAETKALKVVITNK